MEHWSSHLVEGEIVQIVEAWDDPDLSYEFDVSDLVRTEAGWYLVNTAGCSCPSYEEVAGLEFGPSSLEDIRDYVVREYASSDDVRDYYKEKRESVLAAIDNTLRGV